MDAVDDAGRAAVARVLADPTFELIPLKNARDQAAFLPRDATGSVTASPATISPVTRVRPSGEKSTSGVAHRVRPDWA